jgi:hypothetical protein
MSTRNGRAGPYAHDLDRYALAVARGVKKPKSPYLAPKKRRKAHPRTLLAAPDVLKRGWTLALIFQLLGTPDRTPKLYLATRVQAAERGSEFQAKRRPAK